MLYDLHETIRTVYRRFVDLHRWDHYTGVLVLQGLSRLAIGTADASLLEEARRRLIPFVQGRVPAFGNFIVYRAGGNGAAFLNRMGQLPEAGPILQECAVAQLAAPRGEAGVFCRPLPEELPERKIWMDTAFAVCPYLLDCGVAFGRDEWVAEAIHQVLAMRSLFLDPATGLVHQGKNFNGPGSISRDHWSRGNGWGLLALAEIAERLPESHPRHGECRAVLAEWIQAALRFRNHEGLWFQEMAIGEPFATYTETSGSALILYAMGIALKIGVLDSGKYLGQFEHGLRALLRYVTPGGSVYNCCTSCCCPGDGSVDAYLRQPPILNDSHAFGPVMLALAQGIGHGFSVLEPLSDEDVRYRRP